ncbi:hypothetical protein DEO72_LG3g1940 [Vigna unguiculata]|uniref:Uncharacterized protein n=1 Tax=Vigna unguiculata TaxID=3917 RepID=A0A4D6LG72_VIGUN|nr:hypothetical protein DEO72_LG3g1940 [Vigna unguiculata]
MCIRDSALTYKSPPCTFSLQTQRHSPFPVSYTHRDVYKRQPEKREDGGRMSQMCIRDREWRMTLSLK